MNVFFFFEVYVASRHEHFSNQRNLLVLFQYCFSEILLLCVYPKLFLKTIFVFVPFL